MFNSMFETLKANPRSIVFTEGLDARILEATARLKAEGFLKGILGGNVDEVKANAAKGGFDIEGVEILDPATYSTADTVRPALQIVKTKKGSHLGSSCVILTRG